MVCHCGKNLCHAPDLVSLINELFKSRDGPVSSPQSQFTPGSHEASNGVIPFDAGLVDPNSGGISLMGNTPSVAPGWPDEWTVMVESIRGSPYGLAWEIYAGCQSVTQSLSQRGWICAPPVDVSYSDWFNLLNPAFVSIVVGIIFEGRITLLVLDPPSGT